MNIFKTVLEILIIMFILSGLVNAQNDNSWYVGNDGSDSDNGWTPSTAQQTLNGGILDSLRPGDILYIMGGTWYEEKYSTCLWTDTTCWEINGINGTAESPIVITGNYPDSSMPLFDGNGQAFTDSCNENTHCGVKGITVCNSSYIILDSIEITDWCGRGIGLRDCDNITVQNCEIYGNGSSSGGTTSGGITMGASKTNRADSCTIYNNLIYDNHGGHTNCPQIHMYGAKWNIIRRNEMYGNTANGAAVKFKVFDCDSNIVDSNFIHDQAVGIEFCGESRGNEVCYNVIWNCDNALYNMGQAYGDGYLQNEDNMIYNNTFFAEYSYNQGGVRFNCNYAGNPYAQAFLNTSWFNNISYYYQSAWDYSAPFVYLTTGVDGDTNTFEIMDYNCYYGYTAGQDTVMSLDGDHLTLTEWVAELDYGGYDSNTIWDDPEFLSTDDSKSGWEVTDSFLKITASSPCATSGRGGDWPSYMGAYAPITPSEPHISLNPDNLEFTAEQDGPLPDSKTFILQNTGGGTLNWNISDNATWLSVLAPTSGNSNYQVVTVNVTNTNMPIDEYTGQITITSSNADNEPLLLPVDYYITAESEDTIPPSDPAPRCNQALLIPAVVSSTANGYDDSVITDGNIDPYNDVSTTWKSYPSTTEAPWVEIDFGEQKLVKHVLICWAWNNDASSWTTSQAYYVQGWHPTTGYFDLRPVIDPANGETTKVEFATPKNTSRIRVIQLPDSGNQHSQDVMWLTELEICVIN